MPTQLFKFTVRDIASTTGRHPDVIRRDIRSGSLTPTSLPDLSRYVLGHVLVRALDIPLPDVTEPGPALVVPSTGIMRSEPPAPPPAAATPPPPRRPAAAEPPPVQKNPTIVRSGIME